MTSKVDYGDYHEDAESEDTGGNFILTGKAKDAGYQLVYPRGNSLTVVRVIPAAGPDGAPVPYRYAADVNRFTRWIHKRAIWIGGINSKIWMVSSVPDGHGGIDHSAERPPDRLYNIINRKSKSDDAYGKWAKFLQGSAGKPACIQKSSMRGFVHCIVSEYNNKVYDRRPWKKVVLMLQKSARQSLEALCNMRVDDFEGDSSDVMAMYKVGDWLGHKPDGNPAMIGGRMLTIHSNQMTLRTDSESGGFNLTAGESSSQSSGGDSDTQFMKYVCSLGREQAIPMDWVPELWRPWEEILHVIEPGQQVVHLSRVFPEEMIRMAFCDTDYAPKSLMTGRTIDTPSAVAPPKAEGSGWGDGDKVQMPPAKSAPQGDDPDSAGYEHPTESVAAKSTPAEATPAEGFTFGGAQSAETPLPLGDKTAMPDRPGGSPQAEGPVGDPMEAAKRRQKQLQRLQEANRELGDGSK